MRRSSFITATMLTVLVLSILVAGCATCLTGCAQNTPPNTPVAQKTPDVSVSPVQKERLGFEGGNIGAGGLICGGDNGYIYYRSESDGWKLYKAKSDGSSKAKVSDHVIENINVLDGWIYFIDHLDNNSIKKVRTDGADATKLVEGWCCHLYIAESGMYFDKRDEKNASHVHRADLNGGNLTLLVPDRTVVYYYMGNVYYNNPQELGVYNIAAKTKKTLVKGGTYNVSVDDSGIYYWAVDKSEFHHINSTGDTDRILLKGGDFFNYSKGALYYMDISSNENGPCHVIKRLNLANNETTLLIEEANEYFDSHGKWLGLTFRQWAEHPENVDPSLIDEKDGGLKNGFNEAVGYVYVADEHLYMRATLRESIIQTGKTDCIVRLDDGVSIWD